MVALGLDSLFSFAFSNQLRWRIAPFLNRPSRLPSWTALRLRKGAKLRWPEAQHRRRSTGMRHRRRMPGSRWRRLVGERARGASRLELSWHSRLAAVLFKTLICYADNSKTLTCGLSVIESSNTRGYLGKPHPNRKCLPARPCRPSEAPMSLPAPHARPEAASYTHYCI